ncbi:methylated-DNA--[protein]-cysteine S-methyltransferase [Knoellia sp. p5-6-4]|uniref:methylated-DNA--[protein]-cysteine S-methyltransferase n=1 Tax=unclassified Knoellia TaxID=2618719 RepID=UPI0023D9D8AF|nr:methylated-DNA--[protein]-cysteine S-methyltransferase [Knoellia sp. p5-6-4]MDF2143905.1 methylated-DNA--[protein]-cysteine S-methyltransferase [Knoellia sp. p5-6-4]
MNAQGLGRRHLVLEPTPVGPLTLVAEGEGLVAVWMEDQRHHPGELTYGVCAATDDPVLARAAAQLEEYFAGERTEFDLPLAAQGTEFQRRVWAELVTIPYGETATYGELARRLGNPTGSRAVGLANGRNPLGIVVPCHRVVGTSGDLTGYGGGLPRKRLLLDLEARVAGRRLF